MSWTLNVARMGDSRGAYMDLAGKPEKSGPLARPSRRWKDNIKMDLQEVGWRAVDWIDLVQDRGRWRTVVSSVMNLRFP